MIVNAEKVSAFMTSRIAMMKLTRSPLRIARSLADFQMIEKFPWSFIPTCSFASKGITDDMKNSLKGSNNTQKNINEVNPAKIQNQVDKFSYNSEKRLDNPDSNMSLDKAKASKVKAINVDQNGILMKPKKKRKCHFVVILSPVQLATKLLQVIL